MNKQIVAKVKFSKDGRIYNFLVKNNVKISKLKKGGTVIVDTRISDKRDIHKRKKAVLQDVKMMDIDRMKIKPSSYLVGTSQKEMKLYTNKERRAFWKKQKEKKRYAKNLVAKE